MWVKVGSDGVGGVQQQDVRDAKCSYLPKTYHLLINSLIKIISARSMFGQEYPGDFAKWKIEAFKIILNTADRDVPTPLNQLVTNLICIGDSNIEMEAAHSLSK